MSASDYMVQRQRAALSQIRPPVDPAVLRNPTADCRFFDLTPAPFPAFPAAGAGQSTILSLNVPAGQGCLIRWLAFVYIGGGYLDGAGNIIWRVLVNGAAVQGYENTQTQVGTLAVPSDTQIIAYEGDTVEVTVEVPNGAPDPPPAGSTAACRLKGWFFPLRSGPQ